MSDISQYLAAINSAIYGKDVRGAIHDAIKTMNEDVENAAEIGEDLKTCSRKKFTVCAFNVGNFAYGDLSGTTSQNPSGRRGPVGNDTMYDEFIDTFSKCDADVYMFCEWNRHWYGTVDDESSRIESNSVLHALKPFWTSFDPSISGSGDSEPYHKYAGHKIASTFPIVSEYQQAYSDDQNRYFVDAVCKIDGRPVHFISMHFNPDTSGSESDIDEGGTSTAKTRRREFSIIQNYLNSVNAQYVVIGGDFNTGSPNPTSEGVASELKMLSDAGYVAMQGGFWGKASTDHCFDTLNLTKWPSTGIIRPYDNFAVTSNISIIGARVIEGNGSDHYPVCVDLTFND